MANFRFYNFAKKQNEVAPVSAPGVAASSNAIGDMATLVRGTSWFGILSFYFNRIPIPIAVKIPVAAVCLLFMARSLGISALTPFVAILRDVWIILRLFADYPTDTDESFDV